MLTHTVHTATAARPAHWAVVLHGFLGSKRNWMGVARRLVERCPSWGVLAVDLPLHGDNPATPAAATLADCAAAVADTCAALGVAPRAILGHSFGGKVALQLAGQLDPGALATLRSLWLLDATPAVLPGPTPATRALQIMADLPLPLPTRAAVVEGLVARGLSTPDAQWMAANAVPGPDGFNWKLNLPALAVLHADFCRFDGWPVVERPPRGVAVHVVAATRDSLLSPEVLDRLRGLSVAGRPVHVHVLEGDHYLNLTNPDGLVDLLAGRLA